MTGYEKRRVLVVGLGVSGFAAARALAAMGARVHVTESGTGQDIDERARMLRAEGVVVETGGHQLVGLDWDLAVVSPGIPPSAPVVTGLRRDGVEVIGEVELAYRVSACDFLAVTGTNGKTTTTSLLAAMLQEGGIKSVAAGNIGVPLIDALAGVPAGGAIALEVSSFQLDTLDSFRARVAVLLNVAEDHTDWHGSFDMYAAAKARITMNQSGDDVFMPNFEDPVAVGIAAAAPARIVPFSALRVPPGGIGIERGTIVYRGAEILDVSDISLTGRPGLDDVTAAAGAALEYGVDARAVARAARAFRPLRHRLELVAEFDGVSYIDDSKATNPHATVAAVQDLENVVLIAGGRSKGIDLSPLKESVPPVVAVVALGEAATGVEDVFTGLVPVQKAATMQDAVRRARSMAISGGSVLLSPGCASLDMYTGYAERGEDFARAVEAIMKERK